jgi:hypothetical protein
LVVFGTVLIDQRFGDTRLSDESTIDRECVNHPARSNPSAAPMPSSAIPMLR